MNVHTGIVAILAGGLALTGCGGRMVAKVSGQVTCQGQPVNGSILFSPKGEDESNTGPAVTAPLSEDGTFHLQLKSVGKHLVVITPRDVKFRVQPGEFDYPCDRSPQVHELQAGDNNITIDMAKNPQ